MAPFLWRYMLLCFRTKGTSENQQKDEQNREDKEERAKDKQGQAAASSSTQEKSPGISFLPILISIAFLITFTTNTLFGTQFIVHSSNTPVSTSTGGITSGHVTTSYITSERITETSALTFGSTGYLTASNNFTAGNMSDFKFDSFISECFPPKTTKTMAAVVYIEALEVLVQGVWCSSLISLFTTLELGKLRKLAVGAFFPIIFGYNISFFFIDILYFWQFNLTFRTIFRAFYLIARFTFAISSLLLFVSGFISEKFIILHDNSFIKQAYQKRRQTLNQFGFDVEKERKTLTEKRGFLKIIPDYIYNKSKRILLTENKWATLLRSTKSPQLIEEFLFSKYTNMQTSKNANWNAFYAHEIGMENIKDVTIK